MIVCDRCMGKVQVNKILIDFRKVPEKPTKGQQGRRMIKIEVVICDFCVTDFLKDSGQFVRRFMKEGDEPEPKAT